MFSEQCPVVSDCVAETTTDRRENSGRIIGFMGPLMRLYRHCSTPVSLERQRIIAGVVNDARRTYPSLAVLVTGSLAYGMSVENSDVDLGIATTKKEAAVFDLVLGELGSKLPEVKISQETDLRPGDLTVIRGDIDFLKKNPGVTEQDLIESRGHNLVLVRDFFIQLSVEGCLLFGFRLDNTLRALKRVYLLSPALKEAGICYYFDYLRERYLGRLKESPNFVNLGVNQREILLDKIAREEQKLRDDNAR